MYYLLAVLILIVSALLILVVLVQNSKGGGLAANFASSNQVLGVRRTTDFLEKATWSLSVAILVLCLAATTFMPKGSEENTSILNNQIENAQDPAARPNFPVSGGQNAGQSAQQPASQAAQQPAAPQGK